MTVETAAAAVESTVLPVAVTTASVSAAVAAAAAVTAVEAAAAVVAVVVAAAAVVGLPVAETIAAALPGFAGSAADASVGLAGALVASTPQRTHSARRVPRKCDERTSGAAWLRAGRRPICLAGP